MNDKKGGGNNDGKWASVPVFGEWDAAQGIPDYSMDFSKIREMKMKNKHDLSGLSIGNESELLVPNSNPHPKNPSPPPPPRPNPPPPGPAVVLPDVDGGGRIVSCLLFCRLVLTVDCYPWNWGSFSFHFGCDSVLFSEFFWVSLRRIYTDFPSSSPSLVSHLSSFNMVEGIKIRFIFLFSFLCFTQRIFTVLGKFN